MILTIYRGTHEIGGTLIEVRTQATRILIDAGYPLILNGAPIDDSIASHPREELLALGVLPNIVGLYRWDEPSFDAVIISHAHIDHYGLLPYIHESIPVYLSAGTHMLIELSQRFQICKPFSLQPQTFSMYEAFSIGDVRIRPYLMDHSAFDAAAFEITSEGKTVLYTGDFRSHGRKAKCLDFFLEQAPHTADALLIEGTMLGRQDEPILTEEELEAEVVRQLQGTFIPLLFQCSSQNIDRLVSFYKASLHTKRQFIIDVYTANVLHDLHMLGNNLPFPSKEYRNIRVFFPYRLTNRIFKHIGEEYARKFAPYRISREEIQSNQRPIIMLARPSMHRDLERCGLRDGIFLYSLWHGYRETESQQRFELALQAAGFQTVLLHTSGHATVADIARTVDTLQPKKLIPIHTMMPDEYGRYSGRVAVQEDGVEFVV